MMEKLKYDLKDAEVTLFANYFTESESNELYKRLTNNIFWQQDIIKIFGKTIDLPRLTAWYGDPDRNYSYSGIAMKPHPWSEDLLFIKNRIEQESNIQFNSCLLNFYRDGRDSVSWHQDNERELGMNPAIGSVSFGDTRQFQLKHISDKEVQRQDILLTNGSYLLMEGVTQHYWKHQIPKTKKVIGPRINLTFRNIIK